MQAVPESLSLINRIDLIQQCKTCRVMLKNKKKYYLLEQPKIINEKRWTLVKVCKRCKTHNYKKSMDE